jgi:copper chaperone CopZ
MTKTTFNISNITCGHCVHTIQLELKELPGVEEVIANLESKTAEVTYQPPATEDKIKALLAEIDYPAGE